MVAAVDGELASRRAQAFDRHVASCAACGGELALTRSILGHVADLPMETTVTPRLEQATLRAMRLAAAEEQEAPARRWWRMPVLSLATVLATFAVVAVGLRQYVDVPVAPGRGAAPTRIARPAEKVTGPVRPAPGREPTVVARSRPVAPTVPVEPPAELAARPELFVDLPILRHMEKLDHLEAIQATAIDDDASPGTDEGDRSNG
jgi:anti-sigma factor RsiW